MFSLNKYPYFALDTETTGLNYPKDKAFGVSISTPDGQDHYWDIREEPHVIDYLNQELKHYKGTVICHNASFDHKMSKNTGIQIPPGIMDDTCIRACCINENEISFELDALGLKYLGKRKTTDIYSQLAAIFGGKATRNVQMKNLENAPVEIVSPYAKQDTRLTLELWEKQEKEIEKQGIEKIIKFERELLPQFISTEEHGIRVDSDEAQKAILKLTPIINRLSQDVFDMAGFHLNVNSSPDIKKIFAPVEVAEGEWETKFGDPIGTTPKGNPCLGAKYLEQMQHPLAKSIIELRSMLKLRDTFLSKHILEHTYNGRVYPNINQSKGETGGTGTGRLSYSSPAMQQIPNRNKTVAAIIKPCFLPDEGQVWLDGDMDTFEVRVFAHLVSPFNSTLAKAYQKDPYLDPHQRVAELMGIPRKPQPGGGANGKTLNLSMIFGTGAGTVAQQLGLPWKWDSFEDHTGKVIKYRKAGEEMQAILAEYHRGTPGIKELTAEAKARAENRGYVLTYKGRRIRFPGKKHSYAALPKLVQATAADINKENWTLIKEALDGEGNLILNTHDSYSMSVNENWKPIWERVKLTLEKERGFKVPFTVDLSGVGSNWWEAIRG